MKKWLALLLSAIMLFGLLAGCGGDSNDPGDSNAPGSNEDSPAELVIGYLGFYSTFNHATGLSDVSDILSDRLIFDQILEIDDFTMEMTSKTLESWGWDDTKEGNVYKLVLKQGIKFSDGSDLTGEDILASLQIMVTNNFTEVGYYNIIDFEKSYVEDDYTVYLYYNEVNNAAIKRLTVNIYQKEFLETYPDGDDIWWSGVGIIGSGPYQVTDSVVDEYMVFEKRSDYWNSDIQYDADKITIKFYTDGTAMLADLQNNVIDVALNIDSNQIDTINASGAGNLAVGTLPQNDVGHIIFNNHLEVMQDPNVRKAIALAVDWDAIAKVAYGNLGAPASSHYASSLDCYVEHTEYERDLEAAKAALAEAGYGESGLTLKFLASDTMQAGVGEAMQAQLKDIGITLVVDSMELGSAFPHYMNPDSEYAIHIKVQPGGNPMFEAYDDYCLPTSMMAMAHISDEYHAELMLAANSARDDAERISLYQQIDDYLYAEYQRIPFVEISAGYAYNTDVVNALNQCALGRGCLADIDLK